MPSNTTPSEGQSLIESSTVVEEDNNQQAKVNDEEYLGSSHNLKGPGPSILRSWWLEGLAIAISLLLLAAIVVVLFRFDGKEQPGWPYWINLNTIVATLSTILRAQLLLVAAEGLCYQLFSICLGL